MKPKLTTLAEFARADRRIAGLSLLVGSMLLVAGCDSYPESHVVSAPPPAAPATTAVVTTQNGQAVAVAPAQTTAPAPVIVMSAPPAVQTEAVTERPNSDDKWVPGYWTWRDQRYEWVAGHWELPPSPSSTWIAPRWERLSDGTYRFYEGYWD
ncbi:MAG TPA: YXWGXW repeat-containing protein [Lacunisphaera sp.]|jgi:hypothetical protein|nr:YXWGXW repeat-containing protein [Lacunisphaera sp.]